jgi:hypothetical protein
MSSITSGRLTRVFLAFALLIGAIGLQSGSPSPYNKHQKARYIPKGQEQYVAYTTEQATGAVLGTITRPDFELGGGTATQVGPGQYQYTFKAQGPRGI